MARKHQVVMNCPCHGLVYYPCPCYVSDPHEAEIRAVEMRIQSAGKSPADAAGLPATSELRGMIERYARQG
jgi:hypothetical protein